MTWNDKWILDDEGNVIPEPNLLKWAEWFESSGPKRRLERTELPKHHVSTVFLGLDHGFGETPQLWETMVFENKLTEVDIFGKKEKIHKSLDRFTRRYATKEQALVGHQEVVVEVNNYYAKRKRKKKQT